MERKESYTEDELVQMYQDGDITLVDFVSMHPEGWDEEFDAYCGSRGRTPDEECALDFLSLKDAELEKAMEEGDV